MDPIFSPGTQIAHNIVIFWSDAPPLFAIMSRPSPWKNLSTSTTTSLQAPRCASCKAHKLEIDQLKSWWVDQLSSVKLAMIKISDPWVQEWRPWEGSVDQLDIGKSDINDTEVKLVLNTVHNFKGDLKHSKWGPQTFKIGTQCFWSKLVESL